MFFIGILRNLLGFFFYRTNGVLTLYFLLAYNIGVVKEVLIDEYVSIEKSIKPLNSKLILLKKSYGKLYKKFEACILDYIAAYSKLFYLSTDEI